MAEFWQCDCCDEMIDLDEEPPTKMEDGWSWCEECCRDIDDGTDDEGEET